MADRYYYCVEHHTVESGHGCTAIHRLGPYPTEEEAAHALETAERRNEEWDKDPRWNDDIDD